VHDSDFSNHAMTSHVFVTGMARSGTTLLDKLLSLHPDAAVASQPLPLLYVWVKRAFWQSAQRHSALDAVADQYPLNDLFGALYYPPEEFLSFLHADTLSEPFCRRLLTELIPFDGQYTKPANPFGVLETYQPSSVFDFVTHYCRWLAATPRQVIGSKETTCEEYIPYFLASGARVVMLIRDPRDVLTSLNFGDGPRFAGRIKPHLFNLRQWRKSIAFALAYQSHPRLLTMRYEDLIAHPLAELDRLCRFLALAPFAPEVVAQDLHAQGAVWTGNSSHFSSSRITDQSIGRYRQHLSSTTDRFVQALCWREMHRFGYPTEVTAAEVPSTLSAYQETEPLARPELAAYAWSEARLAEELQRWHRLRTHTFAPTDFLFAVAFQQLCQAAV
jgi:Sulfotransferase family